MSESLLKPPDEKLPPLWPYLLLSAAAALWVAMSQPYHRYHNGDSLLPVLMSLLGWTPYFWACTRLGMLLALLASPIQNPMTNLVLQSWMAIFSLFALMFLLARFSLRRPSWPLAGATAVLALLLIPSVHRICVCTLEQSHYPVGMALGFGGLLLIARGTRDRLQWGYLLTAAGLIALAQWVNMLVVVVLVLAVGLHALIGYRPDSPGRGWVTWLKDRLFQRDVMVSLAILVSVFALGDVARRFYYHGFDPFLVPPGGTGDPSSLGYLPLSEWPGAWKKILNNWSVEFWGNPVGFGALFFAGLLGTTIALFKSGPAVRAALLLLLCGGIYCIPVSGTRWVMMNLYEMRYFYPIYFCMIAAFSLLAVCPLAEMLSARIRNIISLGLLPVLIFLAAGHTYGIPSPKAVRAGVFSIQDGALDPVAVEVLASRGTHVCGNYWTVVPITFMTNAHLYAKGETRRVWPITHYMTDCTIWEKWAAVPLADLRVCVPLEKNGKPHDISAAFLRAFSPIQFEEFIATVRKPHSWLLQPAAFVTADPVHPESHGIHAAFHEGFYPRMPQPDGSELRWCLQQGRMTLTNPSDREKSVTFSMQFTAPVFGPYKVWIEGPAIHQAIDLFQAGRQTFTIKLPPRTAWTYTISSDVKPKRLKPGSWMHQHFGIVNFQLSEYGS